MARDLGTRYFVTETAIKTFSVGYPIQAALDAFLSLRREHALSPASVDRIVATLPDDGARIVGEERRGDQGRMHLHFQRSGDDWSSSKLSAGYRQWSSAKQLLAAGSYVFEVPLVASEWGNRTGFDAARSRVENVGFTLSDRQSAGHGVCMAAGTATITVKSFTVR